MEMTAEKWQQVKTLLEEALEQESTTRVSWIEANCPEPGVREEVLSLLEAHTDVEDFLEHPSKAGTELVAALRPESLVGERVGPWRLVEEIGQGGMGTVYRAVRADDEFRREVAIKIVSRGMDTEMLLRRFRTERQILANLEHPYIAHLLDGGTTAGGLPYFVMEYVQGVPLTEYCDRNRLNIAERIQLFRKVCSAVEYAHHNLIVHRDLKPANILVTADGTPKLLDFGIARIMSGPGREGSEPTVTMLRMATPAYASPEQIRGAVAGIPSDIYSLGVILYELLTGHRPYRLPARDSSELARVICEREPTRASLVVGFTETLERSGGEVTLVDSATVCLDRDTTLDQLRKKLRGDLDNILAMALRKETHRRFESVEQFSEDLQRHLAGLPIHARKDTVSYRAAKFIDRHRLGVIAGVCAAIALCITSVVAIHKASQLSHRIEEDHRLATSFLTEIHDNIARLPGSTPAREAMLRQSLRFLNGLATDAGGDPEYRRSLAMAYEQFAELQIGVAGPGLGRSAEALETCRKAQLIRETVALLRPADPLAQFELANNYLLAGFIAGRASTAEVRRSYDTRALAIIDKLVALDPRNPAYRATLARAQTSLAYGLLYEDKWEPARMHLRRALAINSEIAAENPSDLKTRRELAQIHYRIGMTYVQSGQPGHAQDELRQALDDQSRLSASDPDNSQYKSDIASTHHFLGISLRSLLQYPESIAQFDQAIALRREAMELDPRDSRNKSLLAGNYSERAGALLQSGDIQRAMASARQAVELQQQVLTSDPGGTPSRISMADYESRLGSVYLSLGDAGRGVKNFADAAQWYSKAVALYDVLGHEGHLRSPILRQDAEKSRLALARCLAKLPSRRL
jgi:non-specific serine/threonine protein kinase/serine/threonine-protein kinase